MRTIWQITKIAGTFCAESSHTTSTEAAVRVFIFDIIKKSYKRTKLHKLHLSFLRWFRVLVQRRQLKVENEKERRWLEERRRLNSKDE